MLQLDGGHVITANKAVKWATAVWVTPLDIFKAGGISVCDHGDQDLYLKPNPDVFPVNKLTCITCI